MSPQVTAVACFLAEAYLMGISFLVLGDEKEVEVEPSRQGEAFCDRKMLTRATELSRAFVDRKFRVEMTDRRSNELLELRSCATGS